MLPTYSPEAVYFEVHGKLHRGWRDGSGRFTLEQCNLDAASAAGHLSGDLEPMQVNLIEDHCSNCFPA